MGDVRHIFAHRLPPHFRPPPPRLVEPVRASPGCPPKRACDRVKRLRPQPYWQFLEKANRRDAVELGASARRAAAVNAGTYSRPAAHPSSLGSPKIGEVPAPRPSPAASVVQRDSITRTLGRGMLIDVIA